MEETEERLDNYGAELKGLKEQMGEMFREQRYMKYKIEDQENRSRRKNIRIRGLPDIQGENEDLQVKMDKIFGHMLGTKKVNNKMLFERIHKIRKPAEIAGDVPRDIKIQ